MSSFTLNPDEMDSALTGLFLSALALVISAFSIVFNVLQARAAGRSAESAESSAASSDRAAGAAEASALEARTANTLAREANDLARAADKRAADALDSARHDQTVPSLAPAGLVPQYYDNSVNAVVTLLNGHSAVAHSVSVRVRAHQRFYDGSVETIEGKARETIRPQPMGMLSPPPPASPRSLADMRVTYRGADGRRYCHWFTGAETGADWEEVNEAPEGLED